MEVKQEYTFSSFETKINFLADFVNGIATEEGDGLRRSRNKEFELFRTFVLAQDRYGTVNTKEAKAWILGRGFSGTDFSRYRKQLWKKKWLERRGKEYFISPLFLRSAGRITFNITVGVSDLDGQDITGPRGV